MLNYATRICGGRKEPAMRIILGDYAFRMIKQNSDSEKVLRELPRGKRLRHVTLGSGRHSASCAFGFCFQENKKLPPESLNSPVITTRV